MVHRNPANSGSVPITGDGIDRHTNASLSPSSSEDHVDRRNCDRDRTTCDCCMPQCPLVGQVAPRAPCTWHDWHRQAPPWRCRACRALVSARTGTAYAGIRTESPIDLRGAEGMGIRATGRLLDVDTD